MPDKTIDATDKLVLLMVSGLAGAELETAAIALGFDQGQVDEALREARRRLTLAADFNRAEELGAAIVRLRDIYARAVQGRDHRTALAAQKELSRMLRLHERMEQAAAADRDGTVAEAELALIAEHLLPLELAGDEYPLSEHARLAAEVVRDHLVGRPMKKPRIAGIA